MAEKHQLDEAEKIAAHAAMHTFMERIQEELAKLEQATVMDALGGSGHIHYAFVGGKNQGIIKFEITFDNSEMAKTAVFGAAHKRGDI